MRNEISVFWFRRDLRLIDNHGLFQALNSEEKVLPVFIFDTDILSQLENKEDRRVDFIVQALEMLNDFLENKGKAISVLYGKPLNIFKDLTEEFEIKNVFANEDYEPYAIRRDDEVRKSLELKSIGFQLFKDQVIFHKEDILKADQSPYTVFTPYSKQWLIKFNEKETEHYFSGKLLENLLDQKREKISWQKLGFSPTGYKFEVPQINAEILQKYHATRNLPTIETSKMSVHLRFGTISIRTLAREAGSLSQTYLKELIWREFFMQIMYHFPKVVHHSFKTRYDQIEWRFDEADLKKWQQGKTGFPLVDAGMRELNATGFMHNRVRMVCAGFFTKHLLMDWGIGEAYFAEKLLDYDLSANNGNWQWSAGSGCDAAPYFRIFNPESQQKKFDPEFIYIKKWVNEFGTSAYPKPMVDHKFARQRALDAYKSGLAEE
ncbi:cryptochrome/photolyase family protein [Kaistella palustris]|uniref:cryptochrome/photolyase family protein n=1 Tax=Kaistella palustris TaxID=493376 RepID=UPI00041E0B0D|nr:deoxyribodipyrimidine photo-lyase [Kaistella palustris]